MRGASDEAAAEVGQNEWAQRGAGGAVREGGFEQVVGLVERAGLPVELPPGVQGEGQAAPGFRQSPSSAAAASARRRLRIASRSKSRSRVASAASRMIAPRLWCSTVRSDSGSSSSRSASRSSSSARWRFADPPARATTVARFETRNAQLGAPPGAGTARRPAGRAGVPGRSRRGLRTTRGAGGGVHRGWSAAVVRYAGPRTPDPPPSQVPGRGSVAGRGRRGLLHEAEQVRRNPFLRDLAGPRCDSPGRCDTRPSDRLPTTAGTLPGEFPGH